MARRRRVVDPLGWLAPFPPRCPLGSRVKDERTPCRFPSKKRPRTIGWRRARAASAPPSPRLVELRPRASLCCAPTSRWAPAQELEAGTQEAELVGLLPRRALLRCAPATVGDAPRSPSQEPKKRTAWGRRTSPNCSAEPAKLQVGSGGRAGDLAGRCPVGAGHAPQREPRPPAMNHGARWQRPLGGGGPAQRALRLRRLRRSSGRGMTRVSRPVSLALQLLQAPGLRTTRSTAMRRRPNELRREVRVTTWSVSRPHGTQRPREAPTTGAA